MWSRARFARLGVSVVLLAVLSAMVWRPGPTPIVFETPQISADGTRYRDRVFADLEIHRDVEFSDLGGMFWSRGLKMDVFEPAGDDETNRPVFVVLFGGGFVQGERRTVEGWARDFAHRGYVAAAIDYRLLDDFPETEAELRIGHARASQDAVAALRFLRSDVERWGVRTDAGIVGGLSAGGFVGATVGTVGAGQTLPPAELAYFEEVGGLEADGVSRDGLSEVQGILNIGGGMFGLEAIDASDAVLYAAHYEEDPIVRCGTSSDDAWSLGVEVHGSCSVIERYAQLGIPHEFFLIEDEVGHGDFSDADMESILAGAADLFFAEVVQP